jgi:hypothetical protein
MCPKPGSVPDRILGLPELNLTTHDHRAVEGTAAGLVVDLRCRTLPPGVAGCAVLFHHSTSVRIVRDDYPASGVSGRVRDSPQDVMDATDQAGWRYVVPHRAVAAGIVVSSIRLLAIRLLSPAGHVEGEVGEVAALDHRTVLRTSRDAVVHLATGCLCPLPPLFEADAEFFV